jgi:hypothetical protein
MYLTRDEVLGTERHLRLGDIEPNLRLRRKRPTAQAVAVVVEELLAEELLRLVELRRVARTQTP